MTLIDIRSTARAALSKAVAVLFSAALGLALAGMAALAGPAAAVTQMRAADLHPGDFRLQMEAAYALLAAKDARALTYLERAARLRPDDARTLEQLGYARLAAGDLAGAASSFRAALARDPNNQQLRMQLVYAEDALGRRRVAAREAWVVAQSPSERAGQGCAAWRNIAGLPDRALPKPWFGEFYAAPEYRRRDRLGVAPLQLRLGRALVGDDMVSLYGSIRATWDSRTRHTGFAPQIFYDDAAIFAGGMRVRPWEGAPIFAFIEQGAAADISDRGRPRWRNDTRAGLVFGSEWQAAPRLCADGANFVFTPVADLYGEAIWYSRYAEMIAYLRLRPGLRIAEGSLGSVEAYVHAALTTSTSGSPDNRYAEFGGGLAFKLLAPLRMTLRVEGVEIIHTGRSSYFDKRVRLEQEFRF